jgi:3-deoxy-D-manno-octulosonic-acid transferase
MQGLYNILSILAWPLFYGLLRVRVYQGKEDPVRWREKTGRPGLTRPTGDLFWFHAASVGESKAVLPLIEKFLQRHPHAHAILTTGTRTAAQLVQGKIPPRIQHQYAPLDNPLWIKRFLSHWNPKSLILVESEIWPGMLSACTARHIPVILINARMSPRSKERWQRWPNLAKKIFGQLTVVAAQSASDSASFLACGAAWVEICGNIKYDAEPLTADNETLITLKKACGNRPIWLASSTHPGEEEICLAAHAELREHYPSALLILLPRHPHRGNAIKVICPPDWYPEQRSFSRIPSPESAVYIADTLGETGLFYHLSPIVFMGGSLIPHGGQNLLEPTQIGCVVLSGKHTFNFQELTEFLNNQDALETIDADASLLAKRILYYWKDAHAREARRHNTKNASEKIKGGTMKTLDLLESIAWR